MILAITSTGNSWNSVIEMRFGRARGFFIFNTENKETKYIYNSGLESAHGAGISAAKELLNENVNVIITCKIGPKAYNVLKESDINAYIGTEDHTLENNFVLLKENKLVKQI